MVTVSFEVVQCQGGLDMASQYRVVLLSGAGEPKSPYKEGSDVLTWDEPFPSLTLQSDTPARVTIALRIKRDFWSRHGCNLFMYFLDLDHDCTYQTFELARDNEITPAPRLSVIITATGFPIDESNTSLLSAANDASEDALRVQKTIQAQSLPLEALVENVLGSRLADISDVGSAMTSSLSHLDALAKIINIASDIHPLVKGVCSLFNVAYTLIKQQSDLDEKIEGLIRALYANCSFAEVLGANNNTTAAESILRNILREVLNGATLVKEYCLVRKSAFSVFKFVGSPLASQVDACLENLSVFRRELGDRTTASIHHDLQMLAASISRNFDRLNRFAEIQESETLLKQMRFAADADRDMRSRDRGCLTGTREEILRTILDWAIGALPESAETYIRGLKRDARVLWLCGVAGSGKSSIAISVARVLRSMDRLAALYGFETAFQTSLNPTNLFSTIARNHAERRPARKQNLLRTLEHMDPDQRATASPSDQFKYFLLASPPTEEMSVSDDIVIVDAFDESGSVSAREAILLALSPEHASAFPDTIRFIVTCRPDDDVVRRLEHVLDCDHPAISFLRMEDIHPPHTERDITLYVIHMLGKVYGLEAAHAAGQLVQLAVTAEHSFQWASVACRYIVDKDDHDGARLPDERLEETLATRGGLDTLYISILDQSFGSSIVRDTPSTRSLRFILGGLVCAFEPVSVRIIAALASANPLVQTVNETKFHFLARKLSSIVTGSNNTSTPLVAFHTSFTDFLADEQRSKRYAVNLPEMHLHVALSLLATMKQSLRFNICRIESSFLPNHAVSDLGERIKKYIPDELLYACRFWPAHVAAALASQSATAASTGALRHSLFSFLKDKAALLAWLEVISVTGNEPLRVLDPLSFLQGENGDLDDLIAFVTYFVIPIRISVPHIYLSALAFTPFSSRMAGIRAKFPNLIHSNSPIASWPHVRHSLLHKSGVGCVAFSPDGQWVVAGLASGGIDVWDVFSGRGRLPPVSVKGVVHSVAFSPDGSTLATGGYRGIIQLWDFHTSSVLGGALAEHKAPVCALAFSPDGTMLASGSRDGTVRLWDMHTLSAVGEPIWDNRDLVYVLSVAFSADGTFLAFGSGDGTIRLWNTRTRCAYGKPLNAHPEYVRSLALAFSPDGVLLVSASDDKIVRIWDVKTLADLGTLTGHSRGVTSVSFSPNGSLLASCSDDKTIRVWDVRARSEVGTPLTGHTRGVNAVSFSPNGSLLATASSDSTVRLWDLHVSDSGLSETPATYPLIRDVTALSRDGGCFATSTEDEAIQIWDTRTSCALEQPLTGHTECVIAIVFSADGTLLASASIDGTIRLWEVGKECPVREPLQGPTSKVSALAFSQDGTLLASGSWDKTIQLWNVKTRSAVGEPLEGHTDSVSCISFSPNDELLASGSVDHTVRLWDVRTFSALDHPLQGHFHEVTSVALSPDGAFLASASKDKTIRLWDVHTRDWQTMGLERWGYYNNADVTTLIVFSPNGSLLASCSADLTIRVWDVGTRTELEPPLRGHTSSVGSLAFSPDSTRLISASQDGTIRRWDLLSLSLRRPKENPYNSAPSLASTPTSPPSAFDINPLPPLSPHALVQLKDGWLVGPNKELILWIPPSIRHSLSSVHEIERLGYPPLIKLEFSHFACGPKWTKCYSSSADPSTDPS